jgi:NADPH:quinone reductase-like Zn-dependent oxidoreductase
MLTLLPSYLLSKPTIPELDFSGTILSVGSSVRPELVPGTAVFGTVHASMKFKTGVGSLAEYVVVDHDACVKKPENCSWEEASGLGVAGCSAVELVDLAKLKEGDRVVVNGASGGIGGFVVQLAKLAVGESGKVVAICSGRNMKMVKELGADEVCKPLFTLSLSFLHCTSISITLILALLPTP